VANGPAPPFSTTPPVNRHIAARAVALNYRKSPCPAPGNYRFLSIDPPENPAQPYANKDFTSKSLRSNILAGSQAIMKPASDCFERLYGFAPQIFLSRPQARPYTEY
jgi:hypothetical protein